MVVNILRITPDLYDKFCFEYKLVHRSGDNILGLQEFSNRAGLMIFPYKREIDYHVVSSKLPDDLYRCSSEKIGKFSFVSHFNYDQLRLPTIDLTSIDSIAKYWSSRFKDFNIDMYIDNIEFYQCVYNVDSAVDESATPDGIYNLFYWYSIWVKHQDLSRFIYILEKTFNIKNIPRTVVFSLIHSVDVDDSFYFWFSVFKQ